VRTLAEITVFKVAKLPVEHSSTVYPPETLRAFKCTFGFQLTVNAESVYLLKFLAKLVQNTYSTLTLSEVCKYFRTYRKCQQLI